MGCRMKDISRTREEKRRIKKKRGTLSRRPRARAIIIRRSRDRELRARKIALCEGEVTWHKEAANPPLARDAFLYSTYTPLK